MSDLADPLAEVDLDVLRTRWCRKWSSVDEDMLAAWVADSDAPVQPAVADAVTAMLARGDLTYPPDDAPDQVRAAFVRRMARVHGWEVEPQDCTVLTDVIQAVSFAIDRLTAPGDPVLVHTPSFGPFLAEIELLGRRVAPLPLRLDDGRWHAPLADLRAAADAGARLLLLVHPHNPTGMVWAEDDLADLAALVVERDMVVVVDEIFGDLTLDGRPHVPLASLGPEVAARTITVTSAAKSHNLAGVRCAIAHVGSSPDLQPFRDVPLSQIGQVSNLGFLATIAAWDDDDRWLDAFRDAIEARRDQAAAMLAEHLPHAGHVPAEAGFLAWLDLRPLGLPGRPGDFLAERALVRVNDGSEFGPDGEGWVRFNLATSPQVLDEVLARIVTAVDLWRASR